MKLHSARGARLIFTLAFTVAVRIIPSAYAQMGLGLPARTALPAKPIAAQVGGNSLHRALPVLHMALLNPGPMGQATTTNLFAQVAIGGGSTTVFAFLNAGVNATTGNLILTQENGAPLTVSFSAQGVSGLVNSVFPVSIPPGGSRIITAGPVIPTDPTVSGWARVESTGGSLDGVATFQCLNGNALLYIAGVLSMNATPVATIPVERRSDSGSE